MPLSLPTYDDLAPLLALVPEVDRLKARLAALQLQVDALRQSPPVLPPPVVPPPVPATRQLVGGWRLAQEFARGHLAIDFARMKAWSVGHAQRNEVLEYDLPPMGTGTDVSHWPVVAPVRTIPAWWVAAGASEYGYGLAFMRGKLWCSPHRFYDQSATPPTVRLFAEDGEIIETTLPRQAYAGFVKRKGQEPLLGGGGYESGSGSVSGPTLATLDGKPLISWEWPALPGANLENWNKRAPRPANYFPADHKDDWPAWEPRTVNGTLEGRWACDRICGGGLVLPEGVTYWCRLGVGEIKYANQTATLSLTDKTYAYRYDATTYAFKGWEESDLGKIVGQEIDAQGRVFLAEENAWKSGAYQADVVIKVFE